MNPDTQQIIKYDERRPLRKGFEPLPTHLKPHARQLLKWAKKQRKQKRKAARKARKRNRK